jgi:hypothetical protein
LARRLFHEAEYRHGRDRLGSRCDGVSGVRDPGIGHSSMLYIHLNAAEGFLC